MLHIEVFTFLQLPTLSNISFYFNNLYALARFKLYRGLKNKKEVEKGNQNGNQNGTGEKRSEDSWHNQQVRKGSLTTE
jgi:hypothetical protein